MSIVNVIEEIAFEKLEDVFRAFSIDGEYYEKTQYCIFRGEKSTEYKLLPTILRENDEMASWMERTDHIAKGNTELHLVKAEYEILSSFYRLANKNGLYVPQPCRFFKYLSTHMDLSGFYDTDKCEKWLPDDLHEVAALAQHYGLPTRLMDWSSSWKCALYFALIDEADTENSVLWGLDTLQIHGKSVVKSNFPLKLIRPVYRNNENLKAQKGLFTLWQIDKPCLKKKYDSEEDAKETEEKYLRPIDRRTLDELIVDYLSGQDDYEYKEELKKPVFYKFLIPKKLRQNILAQLFIDGVNGSTLFPGYGGVAKAVDERFILENKYQFSL